MLQINNINERKKKYLTLANKITNNWIKLIKQMLIEEWNEI